MYVIVIYFNYLRFMFIIAVICILFDYCYYICYWNYCNLLRFEQEPSE
jgi:hypothetical protein